jgi:hypothetical protein
LTRQTIDILADHKQAFDAVTKRIAALESKPSIQDAGVWHAAKLYQVGDLVSHQGSAFIAKSANANARPGESDVWRLLVKRGRDGKDAGR